jgi:hypothetical protein
VAACDEELSAVLWSAFTAVPTTEKPTRRSRKRESQRDMEEFLDGRSESAKNFAIILDSGIR